MLKTAQRKAYGCALATVFLWSTVASAFKLALRHLSPVELLLWSTVVATLALAGMVTATGGWSEIRHCPASVWRFSVLTGFLNPFLYYLVLFKVYELLPAQQAQPINYTWALMLALLSVPFLGRRVTAGDLIGILLGYSGVVIIATGGSFSALNFTSGFGVALALLSTVIWSLYWICGVRDQRPPIVALFQSFLCGLVFTLVFFPFLADWRIPDWGGLLGACYVGLFEMSVPFVLWLFALKYAERVSQISGLIFLSPPLSLMLIHCAVGEAIQRSTVVGVVLILAGLLAQKRLNHDG
ncbi:MAG: DMT family transporter [Deltaproteobacteria bacterium]|nr:DMT family transporter [Deltaproteobacteria bacterium]